MANWKEDFISLVKDKYEGDNADVENIITYLYDSNILTEAPCIKALVKYNYKRLKRFHNHGYSKEQLSSAYHISIATVHDYVYRSDITL